MNFSIASGVASTPGRPPLKVGTDIGMTASGLWPLTRDSEQPDILARQTRASEKKCVGDHCRPKLSAL
jgi:hypothetical protein